MLMTIHNNVDQTFGFSTFYVFLDFLAQKQEMIDKKKKLKHLKNKCKQTNINFQIKLASQQSKVTKHRKY